MLASKIAWNSGVSGACWASPDGLVWSHCVPTPRGRLHWLDQSGYLDGCTDRAPAKHDVPPAARSAGSPRAASAQMPICKAEKKPACEASKIHLLRPRTEEQGG